MTHIAFLGLGRMGAAMATRLLRAGHELTVWNRTPTATAPLAELGATVADTPAAAVDGVPLVITMLSDAGALTDVLFGASGAAPAFADHALLVEMSTVGPGAVAEVRRRLPAVVRVVDGPVRGSVPAAEAGELAIYLGGADADAAACREPLSALGAIRHVGPLASAAALKLVLNAVGMSSLVLLGEALRLADRLGVPAELALRELAPVAPAANRVRQRLDEPDPPTHFTVALAHKDLALALDGAHTTDLTSSSGDPADGMIAAARDQLAATAEAGLGDRDVTSVIDHLRGNR